jgi:ribose-phosphate pyrophosphokinase
MSDTSNEKVPGTKYHRRTGTHPVISEHTKTGLKLFCGKSCPELGAEIADYLDIAPGQYERRVFSNENIFIKLKESVRGQDVYLLQTLSPPIHDHFMEMLIMIDTLKRDSAARINVVIPYLSYARSDKKDQPRVGITARLIANLIEVSGADRYITVDLHAGQLQGFFDIPGDALTAFYLLSDHILERNIENLAVVATDLGFAKKARNWAVKLGVPMAIVEKRRSDNEEQPEALSIIGDIKGKNVLLVDDEVLTGGSVANAVNIVRKYGAKDIYLAFVHALLMKDATKRLASLDIKEILTTNTLPIAPEKLLPNMTVLSIGPLLAEVILRAHEGRSVGELFDE